MLKIVILIELILNALYASYGVQVELVKTDYNSTDKY